MTTPCWILLEGGGSRTWAALATSTAVTATTEGPSTNPRSVGAGQAARTLADLLTTLRTGSHADTPVQGVVAAHGAASTPHTAAEFTTLLRDAVHAAGLDRGVPLLVTNDIVPLLLTEDGGPVCAVIAGTGTGFAARNGTVWARASGLEWLLTDEGGGHDLAVAGLRAAVRALDGRGPDTALTSAARRWCHAPRDAPLGEALFEAVYADHPKPLVADFARQVLYAAENGDAVAEHLVDAAADELATGAAAVCRAAGITARTRHTLVLSGSLLTTTGTLRLRLLHRMAAGPFVVQDHAAGDRATAMLRLCRTWRDGADHITTLTAALATHADPPPPSAHGGLPAIPTIGEAHRP